MNPGRYTGWDYEKFFTEGAKNTNVGQILTSRNASQAGKLASKGNWFSKGNIKSTAGIASALQIGFGAIASFLDKSEKGQQGQSGGYSLALKDDYLKLLQG